MSQALLALALVACGLSAWQAALAWSLWQQRRVAAARAVSTWQATTRQPWALTVKSNLVELMQAMAQTIENWFSSKSVQALNLRLQRYPALGPNVGTLALRCIGFGLVGLVALLVLDLGVASILGLGLGLVPALRLKDAEEKRRVQIRLALPDALDLLTTCVQAGLGLDQALSHAGEQLSPGPLRAASS